VRGYAQNPDRCLAAWWLAIATRNLVAPAKERIRLEIEAHYADSLNAHLEQGRSDVEARICALNELGDPIIAAKRFRAQHLTENQATLLKETVNIWWRLLDLSNYCATFGCFTFAPIPNGGRLLLSVTAFPLAGIIVAGITRMNPSVRLARLGVLFRTLALVPAMYAFYTVSGSVGHGLQALIAVIDIILAVVLWFGLRFWLKLGEVGDLRTEMSDQRTAPT